MKYFKLLLFIIGIGVIAWNAKGSFAIPFINGYATWVGWGMLGFLAVIMVAEVVGAWNIPAVEKLPEGETSDEDVATPYTLEFLTPEVHYHRDKGVPPQKIVEILATQHKLPPKKVYAHVLKVLREIEDRVKSAASQSTFDIVEKNRTARNDKTASDIKPRPLEIPKVPTKPPSDDDRWN